VSDTRLRVLSYNIRSLKDDPIALTAVIRCVDPDVAVIQEGPRRFLWRQRIAVFARKTNLRYAAGGLPGLGNVLLTSQRLRVHDTWEVRYPLTPGRHLRAGVFARCSVGRVPFVVAGSHLSLDPDERIRQAELFKTALEPVVDPVIAGCDVNENSAGPAWRVLAHGLVDTALAIGRAQLATFPSSSPRRRLDAVFVDPAFRVVDYQVIDTPQTRLASDHLPVVVDLAFSTGFVDSDGDSAF
jgi:endonuclease/exonuclease/phosphatase family metal-dependent hydrolase